MSNEMQPPLRRGPVLTTKQAAEYVGYKPQTLRPLKCEGGGPQAFKQGRLNVYYPADLDAWLSHRLMRGWEHLCSGLLPCAGCASAARSGMLWG